MRIRTAMTHNRFGRQCSRWGVRALAALLLLGLLPQGFAAPIRYNFDHLTTGFELVGQHRDLPCESCHANAIFKGTPKDCGACHGVGTVVRATAKPANHILTTDQCASCHTPVAWNPAVNFDHTQVRGSCSTCHNGVQAQGKGPTHIVTDLECDACHTTLSWGGAVFNHVGVTSGCAACHDNVHASGITATHVPIGTPLTPCESCHSPTNYTTWNPGVINHPAVSALTCASCHETGNFQGMHPSTDTTPGDSRPSAKLDRLHPATGDCSLCHNTTSFLDPTTPRPSNHIPTNALCSQCHTTAGNWALYSVTGTHQGVTGCVSCHGPGTGPFAGPPPSNTITIVGWPGASHIPIGSADCNGSGCHSTANVNTGGFHIGTANISAPTLNVAGHTTVASVGACSTCHESAPYMGMIASTSTAAGDSRPTALDSRHPTTCVQCHGSSAFNIAANPVFTMMMKPGNHIPIGNVDCNGSGCHTTGNVNPGGGGFKLGNPSISAPTLNVAGHTTLAVVGTCASCHESAQYLGMMVSTSTAAGDSRPNATLDSKHPTTGDCGNCHVTTPTFATDLLPTAGKPSNHIPTTAACAQCHTTAGNFALYSVTGTHQGVTGCLTCHGPTVAKTFANVTIMTTPSNHFPIGSVDCNGSGCHSTANVNPGGFRIGAASVSAPTLSVAGHATVAVVGACSTCHEAAPYLGMMVSTATAWGDSRPQAYDKAHPASGDCNGCHTTSPTFATNQMGSSAKPANHIPTSAPCAQCHTTAGNFGAYVMGATGHAGITTNCALCHAYGLSFYNMAPPTLVQPPSGPTGHIPSNPPNGTGKLACELCHSASVFTTFSGTVMKHAYVVSMTCMSCHEIGMQWKTNGRLWVRDGANHYAGRDCGGSGCHSARDKLAVRPRATVTRNVSTTTKPATGVTARTGVGPALRPGSTAAPAVVPSTSGAGAAATAPFNHATVAGTACVSCHTAASGAGKPPTHIATTDACQSCHTTLAWLPVKTVDHTQVKGNCVSCHNGGVASGKPSRHLATSAGCERCHTTNAWTPARFDHAAVAPHTCSTCHNSVQAIGMPRTHIPTTQQCDTCHGTLAWKPAKVDHSGFISGCAACHNNSSALGLSPGHMITRRDCATCHSYPDWSLIRFRHTSAAYPGAHRAALSCTSCHTSNTDQVPYPSAANAGTCAGCHAKDFKPAAHPKTVKGLTYTATELANCSGACHVYSDTTQSTITRSLPGPHHRVSDATFHR
ncbi:MAG: hypothetical protein E6K34_10770 [Gammaproteobacteria bacterium]|nr:MAG: hypothetical protein E6K34_10770 [Gammaproteobacteria bacterium]